MSFMTIYEQVIAGNALQQIHIIEKYPAAGGRCVTPFAVETWGRIGADFENLSEVFAAEATRHKRLRGFDETASSFLRRWRACLDAALRKAS